MRSMMTNLGSARKEMCKYGPEYHKRSPMTGQRRRAWLNTFAAYGIAIHPPGAANCGLLLVAYELVVGQHLACLVSC